MRGVSTWAVAVRKPLRRAARRRTSARPERGRPRRDRGPVVPARLVLRRHRAAAAADHPRRRRARRVAGDRLQGARHLRQRPAARRSEEEISGGMWAGTSSSRSLLAIGLFFLVPVGADEPDQGPARLVVPVLAGRGRRAHRDLPRLPAAALAPARPAPRVRVPRRRAQDDLLLRGGPAADARERAALLAPAPALRHELPADRDDRRDLRVRADRAAGLVLARR